MAGEGGALANWWEASPDGAGEGSPGVAKRYPGNLWSGSPTLKGLQRVGVFAPPSGCGHFNPPDPG